MYIPRDNIDTGVFYQGDVIFGFQFPNTSYSSGCFQLEEKNENIVLISQSCDLQVDRATNERVFICPLRSSARITENYQGQHLSEEIILGRLASMRGNKKGDIVFYPANGEIEDSFVILSQALSVPINSLTGKIPQVRLSDRGRHYLAYRLQVLFGRAVDPTRI